MAVLLRLKGVTLKEKIYKKYGCSYVLVDRIITALLLLLLVTFKKVNQKSYWRNLNNV